PLPSWWAAEMLTGEGAVRFLPVLAMLGLTAWLVRASALLQERAYHGEVNEGAVADSVGARGPIGKIAARIPDPIGALVEKELSLLRREPAVRSILIGQAMYPVFGIGWAVYRILNDVSVGGFAR